MAQNSILKARVAPEVVRFPTNSGAGGAGGAGGAAAAASALGNLARTAGNVGQMMMQKAEADSNAWAVRTLAETKAEWTKQLAERQRMAEPGAHGFASAIGSEFDEYRKNLVGTAKTPQAREFLESRLIDFGAALSGDALQFEARESVRHRVGQITDSVRITANTLTSDPDQFNSAIGDLEAAIAASGLPPIEADAARRAGREALANAAVRGLVLTSPNAAVESLGGAGGLPALGSVEGLPNAFVDWMDRKEAGVAGYSAKSRVSSASGRGQFVAETWKEYQTVNQEATAYASMKDAPPEIQDDAIAWLYRRKAAAIGRAGVDVTPGNVALAWRYGEGAAPIMLTAHPSTPMTEIVKQVGYKDGAAVLDSNRVRNKTVGQVLKEFQEIDAKDSELGSSEWDAYLTPEQKASFVSTARATASAEAEGEAAERARIIAASQDADVEEYNTLYGTMDLAAAKFELTPQMIEGARTSNGKPIKPKDKATLYRRIQEQEKKRLGAARVSQAIAAGETLNGFNSDDREANDAFTRMMVDTVEARDAAVDANVQGEGANIKRDRFDVAAGIAMKTGVASDILIEETRRALHSGDIEQAGTALVRAASLLSRHPGAFRGREGAALIEKQASRFKSARHLGYGVQSSLDFALGADDPLASDATREARRRFDGRETKENPEITLDEIRQELDPSWQVFAGGAEIRDDRVHAMVYDAQRIYEVEWRAANGVEDVAKAATMEQLKRVWGISSVNDEGELMRLPPELTYPAVGGSHDYFREQIEATLKDKMVAPGYDGGDFFIMDNVRTQQDADRGRAPGYTLLYEDENGEIQTVLGDFYADVGEARAKFGEAEAAKRDEILRREAARPADERGKEPRSTGLPRAIFEMD